MWGLFTNTRAHLNRSVCSTTNPIFGYQKRERPTAALLITAPLKLQFME
jgi:hypothetical protein